MGIVKSLNLPEDVIRKTSIISILGNTIVVENFKSIMDYKSDFIRIKAKDKIISIQGTKLNVEYYNREEIKVTGTINSIYFEVYCG